MTIKEINELVNKVLMMQSIEELMNINQVEYRKRLFEYFKREKTQFLLNKKCFNSDLIHDINGLKYDDEFFVTRL